MAATPTQNPDAQTRSRHVPLAAGGTRPGGLGPQALVHLWLLLMIVGALGVLAVSIPLPVYESGLATIDPALAGLLDPAT